MTDTSAGESQRATRSRNGRNVNVLESDHENVTVVCECGQEDCAQQLTVGARMYAKIRRHGTWFLLAAGHELAAKERVVLRMSEFVVVDERFGQSLPRA